METTHSNQSQNDVPVINTQSPPKRRLGRWLTLAAILVVVGTGSLLYALNSSDSNVAKASTAATVVLAGDSAEPQTIKVKKGDTVTWLNQDQAAHQITGSNEVLNSGEPLAPGESFTATFEDSGTFGYHDHLNPVSTTGFVVVE